MLNKQTLMQAGVTIVLLAVLLRVPQARAQILGA